MKTQQTLTIAEGVTFPISLVTERVAWLGRVGQGKTYGAMKAAELMLDERAQTIVIDFVGSWSGLRVPGTGPAYDIPVFGGMRGDCPLDPKAGERIADLIVDRGISAVLDVSQMTRADQIRFCTAFGGRFFDARKAKPGACHIFVEEAQELLPQNPEGREATMLGIFLRIWKIGRNYGIGGSIITQRPQEVNKKALNMSGTLFVFQLVGAHERKAVKEWLQSTDVKSGDIVNEIPTLKKGTPRIWSVAFDEPISVVARILPKRTADVSATPVVGATPIAAKPLTSIDISELVEAMGAADDDEEEGGDTKPHSADTKALRKRVADLESELRTLKAAPREKLIVERPVVFDSQLDALRTAAASVEMALTRALAINAAPDPAPAATTFVAVENQAAPPNAEHKPKPSKPKALARMPDATNPGEVGAGSLRQMLVALAQRRKGLTASQIAVRAGINTNKSTFGNNVRAAVRSGWLTVSDGVHTITPAGIKALGSFEKLPTGSALRSHWSAALGESVGGRIYRALVKVHPRPLSHAEIADAANVNINVSTFGNAVRQLRALELTSGTGAALSLNPELFS